MILPGVIQPSGPLMATLANASTNTASRLETCSNATGNCGVRGNLVHLALY